jgi:hypothetical protein
MRIRDRLRRAWRWARALLAAPPPIPRVSPASASQSPTVSQVSPPPPLEDRVVVGDVTLRFWPVAELVVLASTEVEAEGALVSLLAHPDPAVRTAASARLDELRGIGAVAA